MWGRAFVRQEVGSFQSLRDSMKELSIKVAETKKKGALVRHSEEKREQARGLFRNHRNRNLREDDTE